MTYDDAHALLLREYRRDHPVSRLTEAGREPLIAAAIAALQAQAIDLRHVYVFFARRKRRFWFGHTWDLCHVATTREAGEKWLREAMYDVAKRLPDKSYGHSVDHHYKWLTCTVDAEYGRDTTYQPANPADIFWPVYHRNYD